MRAIAGFIVLVAIGSGLGCAHGTSRNVPFSDDWTHHERGDRAFQERKQRISGEAADDGAASDRSPVVVDDRGRPRLNIGGTEGVSADVRVGGGTGAFLKYNRGWDHSKPARRGRDNP